jgi:hypothetical protein
MEIKQFIELKKNYVTRTVGNEMVVVPLTDKVAQMSTLYTCNETGRFIWENIDDTSTVDSLAALLTENYDIDAETAKTDVLKFFADISDKLLENKHIPSVIKAEDTKPKGKTIFQFWKK